MFCLRWNWIPRWEESRPQVPQCQCRRCQTLNTKSKQATSWLAINEKNQVKQSRPVCDQNGESQTDGTKNKRGKENNQDGGLRVETSGWRISIDIRESFPLEQSEYDCFAFVNLWQEPLISTDKMDGKWLSYIYCFIRCKKSFAESSF